MKRFVGYVFIATAIIALCIAASLGIAAASEPTAEIVYINLSCKLNLEMMYAVSSENIPSGAGVGVAVSVGNQSAGTKIVLKDSSGNTAAIHQVTGQNKERNCQQSLTVYTVKHLLQCEGKKAPAVRDNEEEDGRHDQRVADMNTEHDEDKPEAKGQYHFHIMRPPPG